EMPTTPRIAIDGGLTPVLDTLAQTSVTEKSPRSPDTLPLPAPTGKVGHLIPILLAALVLVLGTAGVVYLHGRNPRADKTQSQLATPPTPDIIVSADGQGRVATIADALQNAAPGERIRVRPG